MAPRTTGAALQQFAEQQQARLALTGGAGASPAFQPPRTTPQPRVADAEVPLSPVMLQAVAAAVAAAMSSAQPAAASEAATVAQLGDLVAEVRTLIENVGSPAQVNTIVKQKAKRYELGASTSREKVRLFLGGAHTTHLPLTQGPAAGGAGRVRAAAQERPAVQAQR